MENKRKYTGWESKEQKEDYIKSMNIDEFKKEYYNEPLQHDDIACEAYRSYSEASEHRDKWMYEQLIDSKGRAVNGRRTDLKALPHVSITEYASRSGVSVEDMKKHWRCHKL